MGHMHITSQFFSSSMKARTTFGVIFLTRAAFDSSGTTGRLRIWTFAKLSLKRQRVAAFVFLFFPVLRCPGTFHPFSVLRQCCNVFRTLHCSGEFVIKLLELFESCLISGGHFVGSGSNWHLVSS